MDDRLHEHNPWQDAEARYQTGQEVRGAITRITQLGIFVQVEPGIEGIIYTFELGRGLSAMLDFAPGQQMQLYVKSIDARRKRLELSLERPSGPGLLAESELPTTLRRSTLPNHLTWPIPPVQPSGPLTLPHILPEQDKRSCPTCQRAVQDAWKYCVYCGGLLQLHCPTCGSAQPAIPDARYCCECGASMS